MIHGVQARVRAEVGEELEAGRILLEAGRGGSGGLKERAGGGLDFIFDGGIGLREGFQADAFVRLTRYPTPC